MPHTIKSGTTPTLQWQMNTDLTGVSEVQLTVGVPGEAPIFSRVATVVDPEEGIIEATLTLEETAVPGNYSVEASTGGQTYPNCGYETLNIFRSLD